MNSFLEKIKTVYHKIFAPKKKCPHILAGAQGAVLIKNVIELTLRPVKEQSIVQVVALAYVSDIKGASMNFMTRETLLESCSNEVAATARLIEFAHQMEKFYE